MGESLHPCALLHWFSFSLDLQQDLEIRAASISALLKQLELDGMVTRADAQWDNRLKEIRLMREAFQLKKFVGKWNRWSRN